MCNTGMSGPVRCIYTSAGTKAYNKPTLIFVCDRTDGAQPHVGKADDRKDTSKYAGILEQEY